MKKANRKTRGEINIAAILLPLKTSLENTNSYDEFVKKSAARKRLRNIKDTFI